jgi:uncharacterized membrane protein
MNEGTEPEQADFTSAQMGAMAHLYRGEVYRSTIWRTRLDTTTNWSVVTLGVALSITFSSPTASPLPLLLVGVLIFLFLMIETRRYRYFNVWRARCRWIENHFYVPMLNPAEAAVGHWRGVLAADYRRPHYHVSFVAALGRRIRRNYLWIVGIQGGAFAGKLLVHPLPLQHVGEFFDRANVGPVPGEVILLIGAVYLAGLAGIAIWSQTSDRRKWGARTGMG